MEWPPMIVAQLTVLVSTFIGYAEITVQPSRSEKLHASFQRSLAGLDRPSERTVETLKRFDVERTYRRDVNRALATRLKIARQDPEPEVVYALAELSWLEGKRLERWRKSTAIEHYLDAVSYAYDFLTEPELAAGRAPSDPRFRMACDIYNGGLDHLIRAAKTNGQILPNVPLKLKLGGSELFMKVALRDSPWNADDIDQILPASDFDVSGLPTKSYQYGLGVPLIGIHQPEKPGTGLEKFYPAEMAFPLTGYLRPNSRLRETAGNEAAPRECTLELIDPVHTHVVGTDPSLFPVEADLTTPLAYMWSRTDLHRFQWNGLFRPGSSLHRANLMLLRPYEPGKIPVVMVHGLASSPLAWIPMINDLLRDPVIQDRFQFMLYMYPTGVPLPIAAAGLRDSLEQARLMYDPEGGDPAFEKMVLIGHSMGGLLSHAMAIDSGDKFWHLNSDRRFSEIVGEPEVLGELEKYLFFKPLPFVKRVLFLATPHRGSVLSHNVIGRVSTSLISDPDHIANLLAKLIKSNPDAFDSRQFRRMPTSIETLDTSSPILRAMLTMQPNPETAFHSIIGALRPGPIETRTDGVVPYTSSHLDGVESELMVRSDHGVQKDPEAILEVRRILRLHIGLSSPSPARLFPDVARPSTSVEATKLR